jgi:hypothetical protein
MYVTQLTPKMSHSLPEFFLHAVFVKSGSHALSGSEGAVIIDT